MKNIGRAFLLVLICLSFACKQGTVFNEPQPIGEPNLNTFPKEIQGTYCSFLDSSTLRISDKRIIRSYKHRFAVHPNQFDDAVIVTSSFITNTVTLELFPIEREGDSLYVIIDEADTLFTISSKQLLKKSNGNFFLNSSLQNNSWEVIKMETQNDAIAFNILSSKDEIINPNCFPESFSVKPDLNQISAPFKSFNSFKRQIGFAKQEVFARTE